MHAENIEIPLRVLSTWEKRHSECSRYVPDGGEDFDVTTVVKDRVKTLSINPIGLGSGFRSCLNDLPNDEDARAGGNSKAATSSAGLALTQRQRPKTTHFTYPRYDLPCTENESVARLTPLKNRKISAIGAPDTPRGNVGRKGSYVLESLYEPPLGSGDSAIEPSKPLIFLARNTNDPQTSSNSQQEFAEIDNSVNRSRFSVISAVYPAASALSNAVDKAVQAVSGKKERQGSVARLYETAKIRQLQLKRSETAQITFRWMFYLFLLLCFYFLLVGVPLWKGLVWYLYILFDKHLVLKAGTSLFLGIGFLWVSRFLEQSDTS